jgi:hypothetical protein
MTENIPIGSQRLIRIIREICNNITDFKDDEFESLRVSNADLFKFLTFKKAKRLTKL